MSFSDSEFEEEYEEGDDDGWIFSYADMMSLLLGFFIILYSFSKIDDSKFDSFSKEISESFKGKTKKEVIDHTQSTDERQIRALHMLASMLQLGDNIDSILKNVELTYQQSTEHLSEQNLLKEYQKIGIEDQIEDQNKNSFEVILSYNQIFKENTLNISKVAQSKLQNIARQILLLNNIKSIEIIGHTNISDHSGSKFQTSSVMASKVAEVFLQSHFDSKKINVKGMADSQPIFPEVDQLGSPIPENIDKNKRIHIVVHKFPKGISHGK